MQNKKRIILIDNYIKNYEVLKFVALFVQDFIS